MDRKEQQIELLQTVNDYCGRLLPAMNEVIGELKGEKKEDTVEFLIQIIDGFNFVIEAYNVTRDLINEDGNVINDSELEDAVQRLSKVMIAKEYEKAADILESDVIAFIDKVKGRTEAFV